MVKKPVVLVDGISVEFQNLQAFLSLIFVQVPLSDLHEASEALIKALLIRAKYMKASYQYFPLTTLKFLRKVCDDVPEFLAHYEDGDVENPQENLSSA